MQDYTETNLLWFAVLALCGVIVWIKHQLNLALACVVQMQELIRQGFTVTRESLLTHDKILAASVAAIMEDREASVALIPAIRSLHADLLLHTKEHNHG